LPRQHSQLFPPYNANAAGIFDCIEAADGASLRAIFHLKTFSPAAPNREFERGGELSRMT